MAKKMNKIEKLIAELCPEGVEWKDVGTLIEDKAVTTVNPPKKLTKKYYKPIGAFPIVDQGQNFIVGYTDDSKALVTNGLYVIFGDHTEAIKYVDFAFAQGADGIKVLKTHTDIINTRFFYYALNDFYKNTGKYTRHFSFLKKTKIPIPPLAIQQEIVKILDTFTTLEAELEAELEARKKQYEYYRDQLLTFVEGIEYKTLGEVGEFIRGNGLPKVDFTENGVGCIHYGQIYTYYGTFTDKTKSFVSPETAKKLQKVHTNDLIITNTSENIEDVCKTVVWLGNDVIVTGGHASIFKHNENPKYLAYYTQTQMFFDEKRKLAKGTKVIDVSAKDLAKIKIPIPPLTEQERIVAILDKFDALVNDISVGLPAELNARRKQYEYYRGKLLTFKPLEDEYANQ